MSDAPRILVTNDDGYSAEGISALMEALDGLGELWLVAPDGEQSAVSHALTLDRPLRVRKVGERRFAVNGTPTDCVTLGISNLLGDRPPDLVVSGINRGGNMGVDVHYSGTVSAAFEGVILGYPAIAVSQVAGEGMTWEASAALARELAAWVLEHGLPPSTLLNANVPLGPPRGLKLTRLGVRRYTEGVVEQRDPRGRRIYWIGGGEPVWEAIPGTDFHEVGAGFISVTPLHLDMTGLEVLDQLEDLKPSFLDHPNGRGGAS
ncbi:MAG: 5'/3'-nucleotidase SurE [Thermoanaerobaculales bacterium]|jgi:5'-nucleotidase|nr:5'/3'-nucleotidase SurE [Thermoanaerobaculales bacterium]